MVMIKIMRNLEYPPVKVNIYELLALVLWAARNGIDAISLDSEGEGIELSHAKSDWSYCIKTHSNKSRVEARKVIMSWINGIFPKEFEDCDWI